MQKSEKSLADLRVDYSLHALDEARAEAHPFDQFRKWLEEARRAELLEINAMILATVSADGQPSSRTVLLKGLDARGFSFFTNYESAKAADLAANPRAGVTFLWKELQRQVNITGTVEKVTREESAAYFAVRPRASQLGAVASAQSRVIPDRVALEAAFAAASAAHPDGEVPLPEHWGGYRLIPQTIEFWQGRRSRLHDRLRYTRQAGDSWKIERLSP